MHNVIVTGGSRGLGLAISATLAAAGYRGIAIARNGTEDLAAAGRSAAAAGSGAIEYRACDLADIDGLGPLVRSVRDEFGPIYGLVNNAGLGLGGMLSNMRNDDIARLIRINTLSPVVLTKYAAKSMMTQRAGRICIG